MILDGDSDRTSYQGGFYMGAHIVGAFEGMDEIGGTVGNQFIKECPAEVCLIKITSRPLSGSAGSCEMISRVIK